VKSAVAHRLFAHALVITQNLCRFTAGSRFEVCHPVYVIARPPGLDSKMSGSETPHSFPFRFLIKSGRE
jgi:hypothetical protein